MRIIKPSFEIWDQQEGLEGIYKQIERAERIRYKSEDKITETSAKEFVERMIKSGHGAMLEHGTVYLKYDIIEHGSMNLPNKYYFNEYSVVTINNEPLHGYEIPEYKEKFNGHTYAYITTNYRVLVENGWLDDLKYICEPTPYHDKRITVKWNVNRAIANEIVRHRKFSYSQQSTRYCNFSKDKFGNELTFIIPSWIDENVIIKEFGSLNGLSYHKDIYKFQSSECANEANFIQSVAFAEADYLTILRNGLKPEQARDVLPLALKTELVMTGFAHDWAAFFKLRCDNHAHPDIRQLAIKLRDEFYKKGYIV